MKNEDKLKLAKKHKENEQTKEAIVDEAKAITAYTKQRKQELAEIKESIVALGKALEVNVEFPDILPLMKRLERLEELPSSFQDIRDLAHTIKTSIDKLDPISQTGFRELWEMVVRQNNKIDKASKDQADRTIEKFTDLQQYLDQLTLTLQQGQSPEDFKPVRLVVGGDGIPLKFLQDMPSSRGGGGIDSSALSTSANQTNGSQKTQIVDSGGEAATVTGGKLDVNATLDSTGLATEATLDSIKDTDGIKKITDALPAGTNQIGATVPNRPSQGTGRTYKTATLSIQTADASLYTVTAAKTLYVTSIVVGAFNISTTNNGDLQIKDGSGGTVRLPLLMTPAGVAAQLAASAAVAVTITFAEPLQFTNAVYMDIITGTITYSIMINGYEE